MNVGVREGIDLARRVAAIVTGGSDALLRYYNEDRRKEWRGLLGLNQHYEASRSAPRWLRSDPARLVAALPASRIELNALTRQVGIKLAWVRRLSRARGADRAVPSRPD
jgi:hypothetical protein